MKLKFIKHKNDAMTVFEVLVVIACVLILAALLLQMLAGTRHHGHMINCVSNLRQVNIAFQIWEGDNGNQFPMAVSVTNGGVMELVQAGSLTECLQCASNEMATTKIFVCPDDHDRTSAPNWNELNHLHVSYFLSADASNHTNPAMVLDGDDNVAIDGKPFAPGLVTLSSNATVSWFGDRHGRSCGNLGFADGHVDVKPPTGLQQALQGTGLATNRIVLP